MIGIHENGELKALNNGYTLGSGGGSGTPIPTADTNAKFDSDAHMNSTDMTTGSGGEVEGFIDGLNVTGGLFGDYVVEQGTDGIWTYRKWNSGVAECWGVYSKTLSISASSHSAMNPPAFPNIFDTTKSCIANVTGGGDGSPGVFVTYQRVYSLSGSQTFAVDVYLRNMYTSAFNKNAWVYISAKGWWK